MACRSTVVAAQRHEGLPLPRLWRQMGQVAERWPRIVFDWRIAETYAMGDLGWNGGCDGSCIENRERTCRVWIHHRIYLVASSSSRHRVAARGGRPGRHGLAESLPLATHH